MGQSFGGLGPGGPVTEESLAAGLAYAPRAGDVIVCSPPRSGTTWTLWLAHQVLHRGRSDPPNLRAVSPWLEAREPPASDLFAPATLAASPRPLVIKSHLPLGAPGGVRLADDAKYIVVLRDPADALVSRYHHQLGIRGWAMASSLSSVLEREISASAAPPDGGDGAPRARGWANFVAASWPHVAAARPNVLFLRFEALKGDFATELGRVASFLGVALSADEAAAVARKCSFAYMREHQHLFAPPHRAAQEQIREGAVGGGRAALAKADCDRLRAAIVAQLERRGCTFPFQAHYG